MSDSITTVFGGTFDNLIGTKAGFCKMGGIRAGGHIACACEVPAPSGAYNIACTSGSCQEYGYLNQSNI